jgi:hypothetical protein
MGAIQTSDDRQGTLANHPSAPFHHSTNDDAREQEGLMTEVEP